MGSMSEPTKVNAALTNERRGRSGVCRSEHPQEVKEN
jgi:hypothetical protein